MTNEEAYNSGWHQGRRWAEEDLKNHESVNAVADELKTWYARNLHGTSRAYALGVIRGYRETIDRWERKEVTWETFETEPLGT